MKLLAVFDEKNYSDTTKIFEKYSVRGIIMRDGKIAMQCSSNGNIKFRVEEWKKVKITHRHSFGKLEKKRDYW